MRTQRIEKREERGGLHHHPRDYTRAHQSFCWERERAELDVLDVLTGIAPEVDPSEIDTSVELRDQLEIDSMDLLNLLIGVHERTGVDMPERDYGKLVTIDDLVRCVAAKLA